MADLIGISGLLDVDHCGQESLETPFCVLFLSHQAVYVPDVVENNHCLRHQHSLLAHQYAVGNLVIRQSLVEQDAINSVASAKLVAAAVIVVVGQDDGAATVRGINIADHRSGIVR